MDRYGSIRVVSELTGQAPKTISDWLRGVRVPHASTLRKFCEPLEILPNWLLHGQKDPDEGVALHPSAQQAQDYAVPCLDTRRSLLVVASAWLAWQFGIQHQDSVELVHATADDAIPGQVDAGEPVLFRRTEPGYVARSGEILVLGDQVGVLRIWRVPENGSVPGIVFGTALWTGRRLNARTGVRKNG